MKWLLKIDNNLNYNYYHSPTLEVFIYMVLVLWPEWSLHILNAFWFRQLRFPPIFNNEERLCLSKSKNSSHYWDFPGKILHSVEPIENQLFLNHCHLALATSRGRSLSCHVLVLNQVACRMPDLIASGKKQEKGHFWFPLTRSWSGATPKAGRFISPIVLCLPLC